MLTDRETPIMHGYASADGARSAFIFTEENGRTWLLERWQGARLLSITRGLTARDAKGAAVDWTR